MQYITLDLTSQLFCAMLFTSKGLFYVILATHLHTMEATMQCSFYVVSYWSASDYRQDWETTGAIDSSHGLCHPRLTVQAGDLVFVRIDEAQYDKATLYRVPADDAAFREFCRKAEEVAGQAVFDKISRVIHANRQTRKDRELLRHTPHDFDGKWLKPYLVHEWVWVFDKANDVDVPRSLEQATAMFSER